jgi:hypothetical protein
VLLEILLDEERPLKRDISSGTLKERKRWRLLCALGVCPGIIKIQPSLGEKDPPLSASRMIEGLPVDCSKRFDHYLGESFAILYATPPVAKASNRIRRSSGSAERMGSRSKQLSSAPRTVAASRL